MGKRCHFDASKNMFYNIFFNFQLQFLKKNVLKLAQSKKNNHICKTYFRYVVINMNKP